MAGTPPGPTTGAKYENLTSEATDYSEEGEFRKKLQSPTYVKKAWSYVEVQAGANFTSTATCYYLKITHEKTSLP